MAISEKLLRKYAQLIVRMGANVQRGQIVQLTAAVEQHEFAALVMEECYKAGAKKVNMNWSSDMQNRLDLLYAEQDTLAKVLPWEEEKMKQMVEDLPCRIFIVSDDPDALNGIDPKKISAVSQGRQAVFKPYRNAIEGKHQWVIAAHPSEKWAKKCFPDAENAVDKLWEAILKTVRVSEDNDPVADWQAHMDTIVTKADDGFTIDIPQLLRQPSVSAVLFEILSPLGFNSAQINDVAVSAHAQPGLRFRSATHEIIKGRNEFCVRKLSSDRFEPIVMDIQPGNSVILPDGRTLSISTAPAGTPISKNPDIATFDASLLMGGCLTIRPWAAGDSFIPFGMKGRKLVSDFLTDIKTSPAERRNRLVVSFNKDIIWVLGYRTDNRYRVTKQTATQLILSLI